MNKTILITGSTDGIGKLTARKLSRKGHHVILHGRNPEKLKTSIEEIKTEANGSVTGYIADFAKLDTINTFANTVKEANPTIDVIINNAGILKSDISKTENNLDIRFSVNHVAPYILTNALLPALEKSDMPRVINLSSAAQAPVSLDALKGEKELSEQEAYAQSKLALTMWSFNLAQQHSNLNVIAVNPGSLLNTKMVKEAYGKYWSSANKGATILYELATSDEFKNGSGKYFDNDEGDFKGKFGEAHEDAYDQEKINNLVSTTASIANAI